MRLIDADMALEALIEKGQASRRYKLGEIWELNGQEIREALNTVPSVRSEIVRCKDCEYNVSSHKCLHPESFFLVPDDDFYCGYVKSRANG